MINWEAEYEIDSYESMTPAMQKHVADILSSDRFNGIHDFPWYVYLVPKEPLPHGGKMGIMIKRKLTTPEDPVV